MSGENTFSEILISGAFAAFTIDLLVYPLDTIKTRLQSRDYIKTYASSPAVGTSAARVRAKASALVRPGPSPYALRGLYQGVGSVVIATLPASGVFFSTYESAKHVLGAIIPGGRGGPGSTGSAGTNSNAPHGALVNSLSSGIAELASCLVLTPAEVIKQNAQMIQKAGAGPSAAASASIKKMKPSMSSSLQALHMLRHAEGGASRRLLSGYTALVARNLPFTALQFPMFEAMRARLLARWGRPGDVESGKAPATMHQVMLVGAVNGLSAGSSGAIAAVVTTPTDVVKTRMMLSPTVAAPTATTATAVSEMDPRSGRNTGSSGSGTGHMSDSQHRRHAAKNEARPRRLNGLQLVRLIYQEHGMQGLFRGGALRAAWTFVGSGLYLGTYEMTKAWLRIRREEAEEQFEPERLAM